MGKYDINQDVTEEEFDFYYLESLRAIANELAEANRLKRLEIQLQISLNRESLEKETSYFRNDSELDQA